MYVKCGILEIEHELFDVVTYRDVTSWNGMIGGYAQNRFFEMWR